MISFAFTFMLLGFARHLNCFRIKKNQD